MKEKIGRLSRGIVDREFPVVSTGPESIHEIIEYGHPFRSKFSIRTENGLPFRGVIFSSCARVVPEQAGFSGTQDRIDYIVNTDGMEDGEEILGYFTLLHNGGEWTLPYHFTLRIAMDQQERPVNTLAAFAEYARLTPEAALKLFDSQNFTRLAFMKESGLNALYAGLSLSPDRELAMEEFLSGSGIKAPVRLTIPEKEMRLQMPVAGPQQLLISRSMWGYLNYTVTSDAAFIIPAKEQLRDADFVGSNCRLPFSILPEKLHSGMNVGRIRIHSACECMELILYISNGVRPESSIRQKRMKAVADAKSALDQFAAHFQVEDVGRLSVRYEELRQKYEKGCNSPGLYLEGCMILRLLGFIPGEFGAFEQRLLFYGVRHDLVERKLALAAAKAAPELKSMTEPVFTCMKLLFRKYQDREILLSICSMLIRNNHQEERNFVWYTKGVEANLRLTRLYDYYFASMPENYREKLPREVYLYCSYHSPEDLRAQKLLYRSVLLHYSQGTEIYRMYEKTMRSFVTEQMLKGAVDSLLAEIYPHFLYEELVDRRLGRILPDVLMSCEIRVQNPNMTRLTVIYDEMMGEHLVSLKNGTAILPFYTDHYHLFFSNESGNRYVKVPYQVTRLLPDSDGLLDACTRQDPDNPILQLRESRRCLSGRGGNDEGSRLLRNLVEDRNVNPLYRRELLGAVLKDAERDAENCGELLKLCDFCENLTFEDQKTLIHVLIAQNYYEEAWEQLKLYGDPGVPKAELLKLCGRLIQNRVYEKDAYLAELAAALFFRKEYDLTTLQYLCSCYESSCENMASVLFCCHDLGMDTGILAEKLLILMLYSNCRTDMDRVFRIYAEKHHAERTLVNAYFAVTCSRYFLDDAEIPEDILRVLVDMVKKDITAGGVPVICQLALTKNFAERGMLTEEEAVLCREMTGRLLARGMCFPYFKKLAGVVSMPRELLDKTMISWQGQEGDTVALFLTQNGQEIPLEMEHVYEGIFIRQLLLFEGEALPYRICYTRNGKTAEAESGTLEADITPAESMDRFARLNRLLSMCEGEGNDWQRSMQEFADETVLTEALFKTI